MRRLILPLFASAILTVSAARCAEPEFPYTAYINRTEVYVRSGPGEDYYPTDKLNVGQEVEIYRHDPGGWYAIRPPAGSYSWVSSRYLELRRNHLAVVTGDRVSTRVGSRFSDVRDVIQVRLQKGETVEVLDSVVSNDRGEKTTWYMIAPPSGEFRWILGRYVDREVPPGDVRGDVAGERSDSRTNREPAVRNTHGAQPVGLTRSLSDDAVEAPVRINPPRAMRGESPEEYQAELEELDLKLSVMVAEEPSVWSFDRLLSRAETMLDQAQTAIERGRARLLVNKIARFDEIKRRADAVGQVREHTDRRNQQLAHSSRQWDAVAHPPRPDDRYDGVGRLSRVKTPAAGGPRYALLSDDGSVACYVSPAPGVNLQAYEGQDVGVNGTRGYMPEQQAQHVVAKHITVVDDTYVR